MGEEKRMSNNTDIITAKEILVSGGFTCVLVKDGDVHSCSERGVKPLLNLLDSGDSYVGYSAADKGVGKAAAFLYVLLGVSAVHACVISVPALNVLREYGIGVTFDFSVNMIRNRTDTGYCPMEQATLGISEPHEALVAVRAALEKLTAK